MSTWFEGRDAQTGKGIPNYKLIPQPGGDKIEHLPACLGVTGWGTKPYNPETGYMYILSIEACMRYNYEQELKYEKGKMYMGAADELFTKRDQAGVLRAFDVARGKVVWEWWNKVPLVGAGATTTGGGLVFVGTPEGKVVALDAKTGEQLWEFNDWYGRLGLDRYVLRWWQAIPGDPGWRSPACTVWFGKEPKLADVVNKMNFGGMVIAFGLAE